MAKIGIVGTTSWGTTLGILAAKQGHCVQLLARSEDEASQLKISGENSRFLPGILFPNLLDVTASTQEAFSETKLVIIAVPSQTMRENLSRIYNSLDKSTVVVSASKGLEIGTAKRMSQLMLEELPLHLHHNICALSGPNLALEIIDGKPSSTVVASLNRDASQFVQKTLSSSKFRIYTSDDIIGVELGGALKNIIAIGAGICDSLGIGSNGKASFITRGLSEISRICTAAGGDPSTLTGLSGIGDLIATCSSPKSRNYKVGNLLASGKTLVEIEDSIQNVAEGISTSLAVLRLAEKLNVDMPITQTTYEILFDNLPIDTAILSLMERTPTSE